MTRAPNPIAPPKRPEAIDDLDFERKPMVRWLSPKVLVEAALRVVVSDLFGQYADKREFQAALDPEPGPPLTYGEADEEGGALWLDFVADLGDGFDSTFAVASLLGQPLGLAPTGDLAPDRKGEDQILPRGRLLVMGGDEVYPVATREEYENRFRGPYATALPTAAGPAPDLLAIPGNHDWYDGLTNFLRFFCSGRRVGGWKTQQRRSYFAVKLPHNWWLLAIDIQLDTFIDDQQMTYFEELALAEGDRVILVTGKPSWVKAKPGSVPDSYKNIAYFVEKVVQAAGADVRVTLTGDLHHYCRYRSEDEKHDLITAGGGGAYLYPTHTMPDSLSLPGREYRRESCFPSEEESKKLTRGALKLPQLAPGLCAMIAALYVGFAGSLFAALEIAPGWGVLCGATGVVMLLALVAYAGAETTASKWWLGTLHSLPHLLLAALPAVLAALLTDSGWMLIPVLLLAGLLGYAGGGLVFGAYLIFSHEIAPTHANEVLACQGIPDFKNFLRLRLDRDGLTIYPVGIRRVPREWKPAPDDASDEEPWLQPAEGTLAAELIERPVEVPAD